MVERRWLVVRYKEIANLHLAVPATAAMLQAAGFLLLCFHVNLRIFHWKREMKMQRSEKK